MTAHLRTLEFAYCIIGAAWLVPQIYGGGVYVGPFPPQVEAIAGLSICVMLLIIPLAAFQRNARKSGIILVAVTIGAYQIFALLHPALVKAGMDYKLPYIFFAFFQPVIALVGWMIGIAIWKQFRRDRKKQPS